MIIVCECGTSWEFDGDSECSDCHCDLHLTYNPEVEGRDLK
jgi:hypothetical protein